MLVRGEGEGEEREEEEERRGRVGQCTLYNRIILFYLNYQFYYVINTNLDNTFFVYYRYKKKKRNQFKKANRENGNIRGIVVQQGRE